MSAQANSALEDLRQKLARDEHQLSELEVILADYRAELVRLVSEISHLQTQLREAEEEQSKVAR